MIVGGVIAGQGEINLLLLIGIIWACCVLGDTTSFFLGRRLGRGFILRHGPKFKINEERLRQVESYFERHGGKTILIGRFVGPGPRVGAVRGGLVGFAYSRFLPFSVIGCGLWATLFMRPRIHLLPVVRPGRLDRREGHVRVRGHGRGHRGRGLRVPAAAPRGGPAPPGRLDRGRAAAADQLWRGLLAPLGRFAGPRLRFLGQRLTPGGLGLEFTDHGGRRRGRASTCSCSTRCCCRWRVATRRPPTASCSTWPTTCAREWRGRGQGGHRPRLASPRSRRSCLPLGSLLAARRHFGELGGAAGGRRGDLPRGPADQGGSRPAAAGRSAGRHRGLQLPQRARGVRHDLGRRRGGGRAGAAGHREPGARWSPSRW